jgi:ssDNA-binding Zn-finger/Zn-ribbon topoisomerase 1
VKAKNKSSNQQKGTGTIPAEYRTVLNVKGVCKFCGNFEPKNVTLKWKSNQHSFVIVEVLYPDCGHIYNQKIKMKQWKEMLQIAHDEN